SADAEITQSGGLVEHTRTAGVVVNQRFAEGVADLSQQTSRHAAPEFKGNSVVPRLTAVIDDERAAAFAGIYQPEVGREPRGNFFVRKQPLVCCSGEETRHAEV